jgi:Flp pilus assembly protein CpaB
VAVASIRHYGDGVAAQLGPLRAAVVATDLLPAKRPIGPGRLALRRVPGRFVPPGTLLSPAEAIGRVPRAPIPAGAYLLGEQLRVAGESPRHSGSASLADGREPVEVVVVGATALAAGSGDPVGRPVDVIVTSEPRGASGEGRTYVAAKGVRLLGLREAGAGTGADDLVPAATDSWLATLALTRAQALRLIQAQNFAREVRLVAGS